MTAREAAVLRDRIARARLNQQPTSKARPRTQPPKPDPRIRELETANEQLIRHLTDLQHQTDQLAQRLDRAETQARILTRITNSNGDWKGWVEAERHILQLRARIRELEQAAGYTDAEAAA